MRHGDISEDLARGLKALRHRIEQAEIPSSGLDETLNFATWNIREFGKKPRSKAAIHYIAEIFNQFDLIAVTEVRSRLDDLLQVMKILGPYWDFVFSDYGMDRAGNRERIAYVFDKRMVRFTGLAAEADPPRKKVGGKYEAVFEWWRPPYMASFRAGNFDFVVLTVHIRWGKDEADRVAPLKGLADWVKKRRKDPDAVDRDIIVVGDMNIPDLESPSFKAVSSNGRGLQIPKALLDLSNRDAATNLSRKHRYDQILHYPTRQKRFTDNAGVVDFFQGDFEPLFPRAGFPGMTKRKFTYELSDHLPLWIQIDSWIEDEQLDSVIAGARRR